LYCRLIFASQAAYGHIPFFKNQFSADGFLLLILLGVSSLIAGFIGASLAKKKQCLTALVVGLVIGGCPAVLWWILPKYGNDLPDPELAIYGFFLLNALGPIIGALIYIAISYYRGEYA
jgi:hypothetical protein